MDYDLDNCPRAAHALRNRISSSGNAGRDLSIQTDAVIIKADVDNDDVEKYRRLVGILDLESGANVARRVSSREADANQYRYDALGRRVIRQEGTTKTALIWWGNSENAEHKHQAGQTVIQNDIMAHPSRLNSVIARAVDGSKFKLEWYHKNYLDHVYAVSDDSGDILEHYRYTAFGEVQIYNANGNQVAATQIDNHILWNTRRRDEVTGYYMYKFRHYSPELGRWLARDPIEEKGGVNLYRFVGNRPSWYWDKLGLDEKPNAHYFNFFEFIGNSVDWISEDEFEDKLEDLGYGDVDSYFGYEKEDGYEGILDVFEDYAWNDIVFTFGHGYEDKSGVTDADGDKITNEDIEKALGKNKDLLGMYFAGHCYSCELVKKLCKQGKIRVAVGLGYKVEYPMVHAIHKKILASLIDGKTFGSSMELGLKIQKEQDANLIAIRALARQGNEGKVCACFGNGVTEKSTLKDFLNEKNHKNTGAGVYVEYN